MEGGPVHEELLSDAEKIDLIDNITTDIIDGRLTESHEVHKALKPLGSHFNPMECRSNELSRAYGRLLAECKKRDI